MIITQEIFEAFLHCPTKAHLSCSAAAEAENEVDRARQRWDEVYRRNGSSTFRTRVPDDQAYVGTPSAEAIHRQLYRVILDCTLQASDLRAQVHGLELVRSARTNSRSCYVPVRFLSREGM